MSKAAENDVQPMAVSETAFFVNSKSEIEADDLKLNSNKKEN